MLKAGYQLKFRHQSYCESIRRISVISSLITPSSVTVGSSSDRHPITIRTLQNIQFWFSFSFVLNLFKLRCLL